MSNLKFPFGFGSCAAPRIGTGSGGAIASAAIAVFLAIALAFGDHAGAAPQTVPAIDAHAEAMLRQCCNLLASANQFTFETHSISNQILASGQEVQFARNQQVAVSRPGMIRTSIQGDLDTVEFCYDGKSCMIFDKDSNTLSTADAPPTIDAMFDMLASKYGVTVPLADLLLADPYASLTGSLQSGTDLGIGRVFDTMCHHLAFRQEGIDWEIWIDAGPQPLPRKLVITYTTSPIHPQFTAYFSKWNLTARLTHDQMALVAPSGAKEVAMSPLKSSAPTPAKQ